MKRLAVLLCLSASALFSQNALYVGHGDSAQLVREVRDGIPYFSENGAFVPSRTSHFLLQKAKEYAPIFVSVRNIYTRNSWIGTSTGSKLNRRFRFSADIESAYKLERVFVVLEIHHDTDAPVLFLSEVGDLNPRDPKQVDVTIRVERELADSQYTLHVFTDGVEVLQSTIPLGVRERILDHMIEARLVGVANATPHPFIGPPPQYPKELLETKTVGSTVLNIHIGANGSVREAIVKCASNPAFGVSAMEAISMWRFLPYVKDGRPVDAMITMPFSFGAASPAINNLTAPKN